eukprot:TRINITY_DN636_c0_g1_i1.p1 TRINITY_DN636_c0_g1~~TRINITY_DN636_c0_g1_i1.p1  ORF type:complete len:292 (-),score=62.19 TRINITY_DN636_c0_g1_i1:524-1399(-)
MQVMAVQAVSSSSGFLALSASQPQQQLRAETSNGDARERSFQVYAVASSINSSSSSSSNSTRGRLSSDFFSRGADELVLLAATTSARGSSLSSTRSPSCPPLRHLKIDCKESRIGKAPIAVPTGVEYTLGESSLLVKGPLGQLSREYPPEVKLTVGDDGMLTVSRAMDTRRARQMHGLFRTLTDNMFVGVSKGFEKKLEMNGVGYRAAVNGNVLQMSLGYSHPVLMDIPEGLKVKMEGNTNITVSGYDKVAVGDFCANIRGKRPPEPYKGKGIKYSDEVIRRKEGKTGKKK